MAKKGRGSGSVSPKDETKSERFVRVVTPRVSKAVKAITVIGYCAGATYEHTDEQIKQILDSLSEAISMLANQFRSGKKSEGGFTFKD